MTIDEQIAVMQAFKEGKEIESKSKDPMILRWVQTDCPCWDFSEYYYRVKPEPEPPKYVPFTFDDDLIGKIIVDIKGRAKYMITGQTSSGVFHLSWCNYADLLKYYKFLDGSPCGKLEQ